ncbi:MAG: ABC transporter permease [Chloroflexi bacterium]|nr:ABC transporter permease [Chloroflexota bacterium]
MTTYMIRRALQMILVLLLSTIFIYALLNLANPDGPLSGLKLATGKQRMSDNDIANMARILGIDKPFTLRYVTWLLGDDWLFGPWAKYKGTSKGLLRGDWGTSWALAKGQPVIMLFESRIWNTILLMGTSTLLSVLIAVPVGVYSAVKQYSKLDYFVTSFTFFGIAMPVFWFGLLMIILFAYKFREWGLPYLPPGDVVSLRGPDAGSLLDRIKHLIMPTIALSLLNMAGWTRYTRSAMLEVLRQDYVRTARAKGLIERIVITKHALRNGLIPLVTIIVFSIAGIFSGAIMTETVFNWKGLGRLYYEGLMRDDWPLTMAYLFIQAVLVVVASLTIEFLYTVVDPRIRYS